MNEFKAFAHPATFGWNAYVRLPRDGSSKPILSKGGRPTVYVDETSALRAAVDHLLGYINGDYQRDGAIASAADAADQYFKPEVRRKRRRGKRGKGKPANAAL